MRSQIATLVVLAACGGAGPHLATSLAGIPGPAWTMTQLVAPSSSFVGADGIHLASINNVDVVCTPWEQHGGATIAALDGSVTTLVGGNTTANGEDARCVDLDADGHVDVVIASEGLKKVKVHWGPAFTATMVLDHTHGVGIPDQQWAQLDYQGGTLYAGGKEGANGPVDLGYFTVTGNKRAARNWTWHAVTTASWVMTLRAIDFDLDGDRDIFWTDRGGAEKGAWWCESVAGPTPTWSCHQLAAITGDVTFGDVGDLDLDGHLDFAAGNKATLTTYTWLNGSYAASANLIPSGVGDLHGLALCDVDGDLDLDLVTTYALTPVGSSWVAWIEQDGTAHDVSGAATVPRKPDQPGCYGSAIVVSEGGDAVKTDDLGVVRFDPP